MSKIRIAQRRCKINWPSAAETSWDFLWGEKQRDVESGSGRGSYNGEGYYVCAQELESRIRAAAVEQLEGDPVGHRGAFYCGYGYGSRITGCPPGGLLQACRSWLFAQVSAGVLRVNDERGGVCHCSTRARFRPVAAPFSPQEEKSRAIPDGERSRRRNIVHAADSEGDQMCPKPKSGRYSRMRWSRPTTDFAKVNCKRCIAMINKRAKVAK